MSWGGLGPRLADRVAIVTGGAGGIGRAIADILGEAGATVVIADIAPADEAVATVRRHGREAAAISCDVSSPDAADRLVSSTLEQFGRLDILVNNAGIDHPRGTAWELSTEEWRRTLGTNLDGVFYCSRAALRVMVPSESGVIINISSQAAYFGSRITSPAYNASKAGVIGLTLGLAAQATWHGVRVNAIVPALIASRPSAWFPEEESAIAARYPLGPGDPRDVGHAVLFLASDEARWISGTILPVHGGNQQGPLIT